MRRFILTLVVLAQLHALAACQKIIPFTAQLQKGLLVFQAVGARGQPMRISEIHVFRHDCEIDCLYWQMLGEVDDKGALTSARVVSGRVVYGVPLEGLQQSVAAKPLEPGHYSVSGTAQVGNDAGGHTFLCEFRLEQTGQSEGKLRLMATAR